MFPLDPAADDDRDFIELVSRLIAGAVAVHRPGEVWIHRIDHWFGHKWLRFSGKVLGGLSVWKEPLTVPPFVANRVVSRRHYRRGPAGVAYEPTGSVADIHHRGPSLEYLWPRVRDIAPDAALFWFSGDTQAMGRGSLMAYVPVETEHWPWFLGFVRDPEWQVDRRKNIHAYEARAFEEAAGRTTSAPPKPG